MSGFCRLVALTALVGLPDLAVAQGVDRTGRPASTPVIQTASLAAGWIEGSVTDERSRPVSGAAVSAQGRDLLLVETDSSGRFTMRSVPAGTYLVRVQGRGYVASKREFLQVLPSRGTQHLVRLRHTEGDNAVGSNAVAANSVAPHLLTAGVSASQITGSDPVSSVVNTPPAIEDTTNDNADDHSEIAWQLRHVKRSVLRDTTTEYIAGDGSSRSGESDDYWHERAPFSMRD